MQIFDPHRARLGFAWLIVVSGLAVIFVERLDFSYSAQLSIAVRTIFWVSVIAYIAYRIFSRLNRGR